MLGWICGVEADCIRAATVRLLREGADPMRILAVSAPQNAGFPWAWLAVGTAIAVGVLAFATGLRSSGGEAEWRRLVASAYGQTSALVDTAGAMLARLDVAGTEGWSKVLDRANDALVELYAAEVGAPNARQRERLSDLIGLVSVLVVDIGPLTDALDNDVDDAAAARMVQRRLSEIDGALERLRGTL
jgi:hypothetical protein